MYKAVLFDFDGVIVDSERYWGKSENQVFAKLIDGWKDGDHLQLMGLSYLDFPAFLHKKYGVNLTFEEYEKAADEIAAQVYAQCELIPGILNLLDRIDATGVPVAIASSSKHDWINLGLDKFGIRNRFDHIVSSQDMGPGKGKPQPDIYQEAARRCGFDANECIVIEDSANGLRAGHDAKAYCIALRTEDNKEQDLSLADIEVTSLGDIDVEGLLG